MYINMHLSCVTSHIAIGTGADKDKILPVCLAVVIITSLLHTQHSHRKSIMGIVARSFLVVGLAIIGSELDIVALRLLFLDFGAWFARDAIAQSIAEVEPKGCRRLAGPIGAEDGVLLAAEPKASRPDRRLCPPRGSRDAQTGEGTRNVSDRRQGLCAAASLEP